MKTIFHDNKLILVQDVFEDNNNTFIVIGSGLDWEQAYPFAQEFEPFAAYPAEYGCYINNHVPKEVVIGREYDHILWDIVKEEEMNEEVYAETRQAYVIICRNTLS